MRRTRPRSKLHREVAGFLACVLAVSAALAGAHVHGPCERVAPAPRLDTAAAGADLPNSCPACKLSTERVREVEPPRALGLEGPPALAAPAAAPAPLAAPARDTGSPRAPPASPSLVP